MAEQNQPQTQPAQPPESASNPINDQPPAQKPSGGSGGAVVIIILIIVLVLIVLGVGGWFAFKYFVNKSVESTLEPLAATPTATATAAPRLASPTAAAARSAAAVSSDYIISDSSTRVISESELETLSDWQLKVARNEIYARHGRPFVHQDLQCYFAAKSWYAEDPNYSDSTLSATEQKNIAAILNYEQSVNSALLQKDSGCNTNR